MKGIIMICADLHVHSSASKRPSEWFLQKVGARESYTDIDDLYKKAKEHGMTYVTVTDHNTIEGALALVVKYPDDTFISVEATTYFPENNCKIHILVYDITPEEFEKIESLRKNIYALRRYLFSENIAHSIAHATYSVNKKIDLDTLEKLILMFDVFEGLNGARNSLYNETWQEVLYHLNQETIELLILKHGISPMSRDPWNKGITGGSDDHAALFIAQTFTQVDCASSREAFIRSIREKKSTCAGRCNDYKSFAFSIYKIFCDFSSRKNGHDPSSIMALVNTLLFTGNIEGRFKNWMTRQRIKRGKGETDKLMLRFFDDLHTWSKHDDEIDVQARMDLLYKSMATLLDGYIAILCESLISDFGNGDAGKLFKNILSALPVMFLSIPFFSSLQHLFLDRALLGKLRKSYIPGNGDGPKRILWFTDTIDDLNGVAINLKSYMRSSHEDDIGITFAVSIPESRSSILLPNTINLPEIFSYAPEFYDSYILRIPSILNSVEMIYQYRPEKIIISTPGPVGLMGLLMSKLMGISCVSIYHTDFAHQAQYILNDEGIVLLINRYIRWFYSCACEIRVPTKEYINILETKGYELSKMRVLKRGFEINPPVFSDQQKREFLKKSGMPTGYTLMWAGRISKDKRVYFLAEIYKRVAESYPDLNLVICGDGPDFDELKQYLKEHDRVLFTGLIPTEKLLEYYTCSDLFLFPSTTDTFGMVVVEAQACGLPVVVTDVGGPQEIVLDGETGFVIPWNDMDKWVDRVAKLIDLKKEHPEQVAAMSERAREYVRDNFSWSVALADILSERDEDLTASGTESEGKNGSGSHEAINGKSAFMSRYSQDYDIASDGLVNLTPVMVGNREDPLIAEFQAEERVREYAG